MTRRRGAPPHERACRLGAGCRCARPPPGSPLRSDPAPRGAGGDLDPVSAHRRGAITGSRPRPATQLARHDHDENRPGRLHLSKARFWSERWGRTSEVVQEKPHVNSPWVGAYQRHPPTETPSETIRNQCITIQGSFICEHQVTWVWLDATSPCRVIVFRDVADFREVETSIVGHVFYSKKHWAGIGKLGCGVRSVVQAFVEFLDWNCLRSRRFTVSSPEYR